MLLRRISEHVKARDWFAVGIDFAIVVIGVYTAVAIESWAADRAQAKRTALVIETLRQDMQDEVAVEARFIAEVDAGLAAFAAARARRDTPPPFHFRIAGSDTPPPYIWQAALQSQLADLVHPDLLFDLGFFYSERDGVGRKFVRYSEFVESEILPWLNSDPLVFYTADGSALRPEYAANMDRLREWRGYIETLRGWAICLDARFAARGEPGVSCRPHFILESASGSQGETEP
jgi:hypothetical protein